MVMSRDSNDAILDQYLGGGQTKTPTIRQGRDGRFYIAEGKQWVPMTGMPEDALAQLQQQIVEAQQRTYSQNPDEAYAAQQQVEQLTERYRQLQGLQAKPRTTRDTVIDTDPMTGARVLRDKDTWEKISDVSGPIPGWQPGVGVRQASQRAPRDPDEIEYQQLQNESLRQKMKTDYQLAMENHSKTIDAIQAQMAAGSIDYKQAQKMVDLSRANMEAALKGTTPFAMEQARKQEESQKRTLAANLLQDRMSIGSNLAQGLLSGAGGIYGKILGSAAPPLNFNPMAMAQDYTNQMGGGSEMAEMAKSLLMGALQKSQQYEPQDQYQGEVM